MFNNTNIGPVANIKVIGIGGGGNNAVNRMINANITSASYVAINTDKQDLLVSNAEQRLQIGEKITRGLGAGAEPDVGLKAAEESKEKLKLIIGQCDLLFIRPVWAAVRVRALLRIWRNLPKRFMEMIYWFWVW